MDNVTLDTWKPNPPEKKLIQSKWRKEIIGDNYNQEVGRDDLRKIKDALKKKFPDYEILKTFGINAETLVDIKEGRLNLENGHMKGRLDKMESFEDYTALHKKISALQVRLYGVNCAFKELAKILYTDEEQQKQFLALLEKRRINAKKINGENEEE